MSRIANTAIAIAISTLIAFSLNTFFASLRAGVAGTLLAAIAFWPAYWYGRQ